MRRRCKHHQLLGYFPTGSHKADCTPRRYTKMRTMSHPRGKICDSCSLNPTPSLLNANLFQFPRSSSPLQLFNSFSAVSCGSTTSFHLMRLAPSIQISLDISGVHRYDHHVLLFQVHRHALPNTVQGRFAGEIAVRAAIPMFTGCCRRGGA